MNALTAKEAEAWTSEMARVTNMTIREILEAADRNNILFAGTIDDVFAKAKKG